MVAHKPHVAIVDDDPAMRRAVARLCGAADLPCRSFASAEEFLDSDAPQHAALLILDVNLPGLSGFELHDRLRSGGIALPVVFITGQDQALNRERARRTGATYLTKPFPADTLIRAARGHLAACQVSASRHESTTGTTTPPHTP